ncbi:MAG: TorF family putative porin [Gallionella sp.]
MNSLVLAAWLAPGAAMAADAPASPHTLTANIGFTTDYIFRGISQNVGEPAVQGGIDYSHSSGFYAGVWGSNIGWITGSGATGNASMELDTYFGIRNSFSGDFTYDFGFIRYNYLGTYTPAAGGYVDADTDEVYAAIGYKWITAKYSHGLGDFLTVPGARGTGYFEINANIPVGDTGLTLGAHAGRQKYKGTFADTLVVAGTDPTYTDYKLSISKDFNGYVVSLSYTDTDAPSPGYYTYPDPNPGGPSKDWAKGTGVLSVTHSF